ncbi:MULTISPECIES: hypothetical protein [unclassified Leptolyngbya]|uniref:hypothetical protein n=1 Tax=unclassified Leptolyngbya TaxID=2650499 RepID=UPI001687BB5D|nr:MULTISPECIES: hypothetical protein [unclassified Leptolyngbya]MBD1911602.1 hypothetical protein [Leptolyngbya sp. FACHB-8]MBD2158765.1 hypothetical protein [Leptolyngbya sp. FACHB-16]
MAETVTQTCPVCQVKIVPCGVMGDRVEFAFGAPSTRDVLWQRVCRHTQKNGCINKGTGNTAL